MKLDKNENLTEHTDSKGKKISDNVNDQIKDIKNKAGIEAEIEYYKDTEIPKKISYKKDNKSYAYEFNEYGQVIKYKVTETTITNGKTSNPCLCVKIVAIL